MKRAIVGILLITCLAGCSSGKRIAKANDELRLERESQREKIAVLEGENAELKSKVTELNNRLESPVPDDVLSALPRVAKIAIGRASSIEIDGEATDAVFLISTADGKGRFVQCVATVELRVVEIGEQGSQPRLLGERVVTPEELRESYAPGFGGASYLLRVPLNRKPETNVTLRAQLHDAVTGASFEADRIVTITPATVPLPISDR